jgi:two-component system response regulator RegA
MTGEEKTLLLVEDDRPLRERLARALETRGFTVLQAESVAEGKARAKEAPPAYAVVDLKLEDGNGLDVVETLHTTRPESRVVVLTGFGNIATAVAAVKYGAIDYLPKPADADDIPGGADGGAGLQAQAAGKSHVGRPRALGAYPAGL